MSLSLPSLTEERKKREKMTRWLYINVPIFRRKIYSLKIFYRPTKEPFKVCETSLRSIFAGILKHLYFSLWLIYLAYTFQFYCFSSLFSNCCCLPCYFFLFSSYRFFFSLVTSRLRQSTAAGVPQKLKDGINFSRKLLDSSLYIASDGESTHNDHINHFYMRRFIHIYIYTCTQNCTRTLYIIHTEVSVVHVRKRVCEDYVQTDPVMGWFMVPTLHGSATFLTLRSIIWLWKIPLINAHVIGAIFARGTDLMTIYWFDDFFIDPLC